MATQKFCIIRKRLPDTYQEVEYLQSSGTQYINTGILSSKDNRYVGKFNVVEEGTGTTGLFGARYSATSSANILAIYKGRGVGNRCYYPYYGSVAREPHEQYTFNTDFTVDFNKNKCYIDSNLIEEFPTASTEFNNQRNIYLLNANNNNSLFYVNSGTVRCYYFNIYNNDTLVRCFVPCYRIADNVAGMYDTVNGAFYTNQGTGTFTVGNIIPTKFIVRKSLPRLLPQGYTLVDGLITDGVAYVDTGIVPDTTSKWDFYGTFKVAQNGDQVILGCREDSGNTRFFPFATAATGGVMKSNYAYSAYAYGNNLTVGAKYHIYTHLEDGWQSSQVEGSASPDTRALTMTAGTVLTKSLHLFRNNYSSPNECKNGTTCWYIKAVKDGVAVGVFVSCKRDSDGAYGLYDFVTNTFKGNANTSGTLSGGQDIVEVEYLQSSGTQYIDTGLKGNQDTEFDITAQYVGASTSSLAGLFGTRTSAQNKAVIVAGYQRQVITGFGNTETQVVFDFDEHNFKLDDDNYYYDGTLVKSFNPSTFETDSTMILFGRRNGSSMSLSAWKVKKLYVTNGTEVRDYVPVRIGTVGYMLDKANWRTYGNAGTGAFTYGDDKQYEFNMIIAKEIE